MSDLSPTHVRKIARLARLELSDADVAKYQGELSAVLGYMERLRELDLAGVEPMAGGPVAARTDGIEAPNRLDKDEVGGTIATEVLLRMAPAVDGPFVKVPKVFEEGGA